MKVLVALLMVACTTTMFAQDAEADSSASNDAFDMSMGFTTSQPFFRPLGGITSWSLQDASDIENSITFGAVLGFESTKNIPNSSIAKNQAKQPATEGTDPPPEPEPGDPDPDNPEVMT